MEIILAFVMHCWIRGHWPPHNISIYPAFPAAADDVNTTDLNKIPPGVFRRIEISGTCGRD